MINKEENLALCIIVLSFIGLMYLLYFVVSKVNEDCYKPNTSIEHIRNIDSLKNVNNTIIIEVEHLDSVKNEKIIKVKELDNDSTLKLFYKLLRK